MLARRHALLLLSIFLTLVPLHQVVADEAKEKAAVAVARAWLAVVDGGAYAKSWETAAVYFKSAVKKDQWEASMTAARKPLGKVLSRKLTATQYATALPGAPDGEYVVIQYATSFEHKNAAVETVTPMRDADGKWRVAGYYIR